ncbi:hypothetical protein PtB15_6B607 [Puccinia triticina]|nr:hypothetical protein PtB15_6B607 [Puccinia triticina]
MANSRRPVPTPPQPLEPTGPCRHLPSPPPHPLGSLLQPQPYLLFAPMISTPNPTGRWPGTPSDNIDDDRPAQRARGEATPPPPSHTSLV